MVHIISRLQVAAAVTTDAAVVAAAVTVAALELMVSRSSGMESGSFRREGVGSDTSSTVSPFLLMAPFRLLDFFGVLDLILTAFLGVSGKGRSSGTEDSFFESGISGLARGIMTLTSETVSFILVMTVCVSGSITSLEGGETSVSGVGICAV